MKKKLIAVLLTLMSMLPICAIPMEIYLGGSFFADRDYISKDTSHYFKIMNEDPDFYIDNIRRLGGGIELTYFPYSPIKLGLTLNYQMLIPIGFQRASVADDTAQNVVAHINYAFQAKHNLSIGLSYYWMMGETFGMYFDAGGTLSIHNVPLMNEKNDRTEISYISFKEYGVYGDTGLLLRHKNSFYKIGMHFLGTLSNKDTGFAVAITLAGGYIFSI